MVDGINGIRGSHSNVESVTYTFLDRFQGSNLTLTASNINR